jgi:hypothetical protein
MFEALHGFFKKADDLGGEAPTYSNPEISEHDTELKKKVIDFIKKNPDPSDEVFHALAEGMGESPHKLERIAYSIISDFVAEGRYHSEDPEIEPELVDEGAAVEMEHTDNPEIAARIAKDHITENEGYYPALKKMEDKIEKEAAEKAEYKKEKPKKKKCPLASKALLIRSKMAGGPGSGNGATTSSIIKDFPDMEMSPLLSIGKRGAFLDKNKPFEKEKMIKMDKIKYVIQEKYVPAKVERMRNKSDEVLDIPCDIMIDSKKWYHVLDGHHRFLTAKKKNKHELKCNVYQAPKEA